MDYKEAAKECGIGINRMQRLKKELFKEKKTKFTNEDIEFIQNYLYNGDQEIIKLKKEIPTYYNEVDEIDIEKAGENEYYAKIEKDEKIFSVGVYNSTDLNMDIKFLANRGLKLTIIDYNEANEIYHVINKVVENG